MRFRVPVLAVLVALIAGCESRRAQPAPGESSAEARPDHRAARLAFQRHAAEARLDERMPVPARFSERSCPDQRIVEEAPSRGHRVLAFGARDGRYQRKRLLPLDVIRALTRDPSRRRARDFFVETQPYRSPRLRSDEAARRLKRYIDALERRQFKAELIVTLYQKPRLILKKGALRRTWRPGILRVWLTIYRIDTSELYCQTEIVVRNTIDGETTRKRLERDTRRELVGALVGAVRSQIHPALERMTRVLHTNIR